MIEPSVVSIDLRQLCPHAASGVRLTGSRDDFKRELKELHRQSFSRAVRQCYRIDEKTLIKWRNGQAVEDMPMVPMGDTQQRTVTYGRCVDR